MRALCQRVKSAAVEVDGRTVGGIERGMLVYLGVATGDSETQARYIADKIVNMRIFEDDAGKMNLSLLDISGGVLLVSNFTLAADCRKGRRPSFDTAAAPELAEKLYETVARLIAETGLQVEKGVFGAYMLVSSTNDGPVNFVIDT